MGSGLFDDLDPSPTPAPTPTPAPAPTPGRGAFDDLDPDKTYHRDRLSHYLANPEQRDRVGAPIYNADVLASMRQAAAEEGDGGVTAIRAREGAYRQGKPVGYTPERDFSAAPDPRGVVAKAKDLQHAQLLGMRTGLFETTAAIDTALNGVGLFPDAATQNMHELANESRQASDLGGLQGTAAGAGELIAGSAGYLDPLLAPVIAGGQARRDVLDATGDGVLAEGDQLKAGGVGAGSAVLTALAPGAGRAAGRSIARAAPRVVAPVAEAAATGTTFIAPQPILTGAVAGEDDRLQERSRQGIQALPKGVAELGLLSMAPRAPSLMRPGKPVPPSPAANLPRGEHARLERLWDDAAGAPADQRLPLPPGARPAKTGAFDDLDPARHTDTEPKAPEVEGPDHVPDLLDGFEPEQLGEFARAGGGTETVSADAVREARAQVPTEKDLAPVQHDVVSRETEPAPAKAPPSGGGFARGQLDDGGFKERGRQTPAEANAETERITPLEQLDPANGEKSTSKPLVQQEVVPAARTKGAPEAKDTFGSPEGEHQVDDLVDVYVPSTKKTVRAQVEKVNGDGTLRLKTESGSILPRVAGHRVTKIQETADAGRGGATAGAGAVGKESLAPQRESAVPRPVAEAARERAPAPAMEPADAPGETVPGRRPADPVPAKPAPAARAEEAPAPEAEPVGIAKVARTWSERTHFTGDELHAEAARISKANRATSERILGPDNARRWESGRVGEEWLEKLKDRGEIKGLSPDAHFGSPEWDAVVGPLFQGEDHIELAKFARKIKDIESADSPDDLGRHLAGRQLYEMTHALKKDRKDWTLSESEAMTIFETMQRVAKEKGFHPDEVNRGVFRETARAGYKPNDIADLLYGDKPAAGKAIEEKAKPPAPRIEAPAPKPERRGDSNDDFTDLPGQDSPARDLEGTSTAIDAPKNGRLDHPALKRQWEKAGGSTSRAATMSEPTPKRSESAHNSAGDEGQASPARMFDEDAQASGGHPASPKRIDVDPLQGGTGGRKTKDILLDFQKAIGKPVRIGKAGGEAKGTGGTYFPGTSKTVVKYHNDIDVTSHELAHALDDEYGIVGEWAGKDASPFDAELSKFWDHGSQPPANASAAKAQTYRRAEGVAEYLRAALVNPKAARAAAPEFSAFIKSKLPPEVRSALNNFSDEVRRWAGQGSLERTMANVRDIGATATGGKGVTAKLRETLRGEHGDLFRYGWMDRAKEEVVDALWPAVKGIRAAKDARGRDLLPENDPETLLRLVGGSNDVMGEILEHGPIDLNGKPRAGIEGGADHLLNWADTTSQESIKRDTLMAAAVGISERVGDEVVKQTAKGGPDLQERLQRLTGAGGGIFSDINEARRALVEFSKLPEKDQARIREGIRRLRAWNEATLRHAVDTGLLSEKSYDRIKKENPHYIDMHRVFENEKIGDALKTFKGSMRQIDNPFVGAAAMTDSVYRQGAHNMALRAFRDLLVSDRGMYDGKPLSLDEIGGKMKESEGGGTLIMVDGVPERWQFQPDIQRALDGWGQIDSPGMLGKLLAVPGQMLRYGVTHSPPFLLRNAFRDAFNRAIISKNGSKPWDIFHPIDKADMAAYRRAGGGQAGHYLRDRVDYHQEIAKRVRELAKDENTTLGLFKRAPGAGLNWWHELAKGSEIIGRQAEFRAALAKAKAMGYNERNQHLYAASQARGLLDYAVAGTFIKKASRYVPFLNASVQGLHRTYTSAKMDPAGFAKRWSAYVLSTSLAFKGLQAALHSPEDDEDYRQLPAWRKDMFWNVKVGGRWLSLPKPFELGAMAAPVERMIDSYRGDEHATDGLAGSLAKSVMPIDDGTLAGPLRATVETMANWDFFRDKHIVGPHEEGKDVALRKGTKNSSNLGQSLQSLLGVDARKVDHWIRGTLGTAGGMLLSGTDAVTGSERTSADSLLQSFVGLTSTTPSYGARDVEWVMKEADRLGEGQRAPIRGLENLLRQAINAPKDEQDAKAREARRVASALRRGYEAREPVAPAR